MILFSEDSRKWIKDIKYSKLLRNIDYTLEEHRGKRRPKVAIIDTGYDGKASWLDNVTKLRLSQRGKNSECFQNWMDFWKDEKQPRDDFGHGTLMLYTVTRIAPFADVCVARIAGNSADLCQHPSETSENLAKVRNIDFRVKFNY